MSYITANHCQGLFSHRPRLPGRDRALGQVARAAVLGLMLLLGSVAVAYRWLPVAMTPVSVPETQQKTHLYLQDPAAPATVRKDLGDSISPSTVLGPTLR